MKSFLQYMLVCAVPWAVTAAELSLPDALDDVAQIPVMNCMNVQIPAFHHEDTFNPINGDSGSWGSGDSRNDDYTTGIGEIVTLGSYVTTQRGNYHHLAADLSGADGLPSLVRIHRYREDYYPSSFGPGVYSQADVQLNADGRLMIRMFDPLGAMEMIFRDTDSDGVYQDTRTRSLKSLTLYAESSADLLNGVAGTVVSAQTDAASAIMEAWDGRLWYFDMFNRAEGLGWTDLRGRLASLLAADGTTFASVSYEFEIGSAPTLGGNAYFRLDSLTTAADTLYFAYGDELVGSSYPVSAVGRAFKPSGELRALVRYEYGLGSDTDYLPDPAYEDNAISALNTSWDRNSALLSMRRPKLILLAYVASCVAMPRIVRFVWGLIGVVKPA
jgi:hypothetical protein